MGETDSRRMARQNIMDEIRARALREVGAYIETRTTLKNDDLQEETKVITASMVQIVETSEHFSLLKDGHEQLSVTARVTVDESELKARIMAAQHDRAEKQVLQDQLTAQERENAVLEAQLGRSRASSMNIPPPPLLRISEGRSKFISPAARNTGSLPARSWFFLPVSPRGAHPLLQLRGWYGCRSRR